MRDIVEGLSTTNAYPAGTAADLIVRGASILYTGATTRSLASRWIEEPSPHCRRWHRMYGLCRSHDGLSLAQTVEGALDETGNMLQRMRELSIQAATDTMTTSDREAIQSGHNS